MVTAIRKDLTDKLVVENRTDLVNHLYFILLEIWELDQQSKKPGRKTRALNVYDNRVGQSCTWSGGNPCIRRTLKDVKWEPIIRGRFLMAGDVNAHSPVWNPHCRRRQTSAILEDLIEQFGLLINNEPGRATQPLSREVSVIDLVLSSAQLGPLTLWEIPEKHPSFSDHELIVLRWKDVEYNSINKSYGRVTGWDIEGIINNSDSLQAAQLEWVKSTQNCHIIDNSCTQ